MRFTSNRRQVKSAMDSAKKNMLEAVGMAASSHVQQVVQSKNLIDSGDLLGSISYEVDDDAVYVGSKLAGEDYPIYLEKGTSRMGAYSYLRPGILDNAANLKRVAERNYKL